MSFPALLFDSTLKATILLSAAALVSLALRSRPVAFRHLPSRSAACPARGAAIGVTVGAFH